MNQCKKCGKEFPNRCFIEGKEVWLHVRSYCLECSPYKAKKGYKLRKENTLAKAGLEKQCPICSRQFTNSKNDVCSTCRGWHARYKNKQRAIELLGSKCKGCGCVDFEVLTFHHINSDQKDFTLAAFWSKTNWSKLRDEVVKCELLCCNCHQKLHVKERENHHKIVLEYYQNHPAAVNQYV